MRLVWMTSVNLLGRHGVPLAILQLSVSSVPLTTRRLDNTVEASYLRTQRHFLLHLRVKIKRNGVEECLTLPVAARVTSSTIA